MPFSITDIGACVNLAEEADFLPEMEGASVKILTCKDDGVTFRQDLPAKKRKIAFKFLFCLALLLSAIPTLSAQAQSRWNRIVLEGEGDAVFATRLDARQPNDPQQPATYGTRFSLLSLTGKGPFGAYRITATINFNSKHGLRLVYAPLEVKGTGVLSMPVLFAGENYAPGVPTQGVYRFNSPRIGYRYTLVDRPKWQLKIGASLLIRDAKIQLTQGAVTSRDTDLGFVPLAALDVRYSVTPRWHIVFDGVGLAGGPGRAVDVALKTNYDLTNHYWIGAGYRILDGGADVKRVFTFATFHYAFASIGVRF